MYAHYDKTTFRFLGWYNENRVKKENIPIPNIKIADDIYNSDISKICNFVDIDNATVFFKDLRTLDELKSSRLKEINQACRSAITSGFTSLSLGPEHIYQSDEIDQTNLMGAKVRGTASLIKCSADGGETWEYKIHTADQVNTVYNDGASWVETNLIKADTLKRQIETIMAQLADPDNTKTDEEIKLELEAIRWEEV